jgi:hypothetical protein
VGPFPLFSSLSQGERLNFGSFDGEWMAAVILISDGQCPEDHSVEMGRLLVASRRAERLSDKIL